MLDKSLDEITESDLEQLRENEVCENLSIEYKERLPGESADDRREFLADVSAFANVAGGQILYGVKDEKGLPVEISGVDIDNLDELKQQLENLLRDSIEPRLHGVEISAVSLPSSKRVLIVRVGRSWASPHAVTYRGQPRFYKRNSTGRHPMSVSELRVAFTLSQSVSERVRSYRQERLQRIREADTPVTLPQDSPKSALHVIPYESLEIGANIDLRRISVAPQRLPLVFTLGTESLFNFDGFVVYSSRDLKGRAPDAYVQLGHTGVLEAVDTWFLVRHADMKAFEGAELERRLIDAVRKYLPLLGTLGLAPPAAIAISLMGVRGYSLATRSTAHLYESAGRLHPIERDDLIVPVVITDTWDADVPLLLKPVFDQIWNAAGYPRSSSYDKDGWRGDR